MAGFTAGDLLARAGAGSFERGQQYLDQVGDLHRSAQGVRATVAGTYPYDVLLTFDRELGVDGQCSCPYGEEGNFCKHCVAVGLALLAAEGSGPLERPDGADPIRRYLDTLDRAELVDRLVELAGTDPALRRRLNVQARRAEAGPPDPDAIRFTLAAVLTVEPGGTDVERYADAARELCLALDDLLETGRAAEVVRLAERAVELVAGAVQELDDPSGLAREVLDELIAVHARACALAPPDPGRLAAWLITLAAHPAGPVVRIDDYADGLGSGGLAAYRRRLDELAAAGPGGPGRAIVAALRADLAEHEGDLDELVGVLTCGPMRPDDYLRLATAMRAAGRQAEALDWAERGLADAPWLFSAGLAEFVSREYVAIGRREDAIALRRHRFGTHPSPSTYADLRRTAELIDPHSWPAHRSWALERLEAAAARSSGARFPTDPGSVLVRLLLAESDPEAAWQAYQSWGADEATELALAQLRAPSHPRDAIPILRAQVESLATADKPKLHPRAAKLAAQLRDCYRRAGDEAAWTRYLAELVTRHRRRLAFIGALDKRGLLPRR